MCVVIRFPGHRLHRCPPTCEGCCVCEGGLALCDVCGGAEASLPTHCPGQRMSELQEGMVQRGRMDYTWRRGWHHKERAGQFPDGFYS